MERGSIEAVSIAVLASGSGSNLEAILEALEGRSDARVSVVVSDRDGAYALERAAKRGVDTRVIAHDDPDVLLQALESHDVEWIVLAGYLRKVPSVVLDRYPQRILNIHPALLPRFGGPGMYGRRVHEAVLASGEQESGPTVHIVDEEYDHGPIVAQARVPVLDDDTPDTLAARVLAAEHELLPRVVIAAAEGRVRCQGGRAWIETATEEARP